jgi:hypothetical protein
MMIWTAIRAISRKNPDNHYPAMSDDRQSFMKSQTVLATAELDALSKTARGESRMSEYSGVHDHRGPRTDSRADEVDSRAVVDRSDDIESGETRGRRLSRKSEKSIVVQK